VRKQNDVDSKVGVDFKFLFWMTSAFIASLVFYVLIRGGVYYLQQ